jgi:hypothetical protein
MKQWIGLVLTGSALVAILALPPMRLDGPEQQRPRMAEEMREAALRDELRETAAVLQRYRLADRYIARALAEEGSVAFGLPPLPPVEQVLSMVTPEARPEAERNWPQFGIERHGEIDRTYRERLAAELSRDGLDGTDFALGLFVVTSSEGAEDGFRGTSLGNRPEYFWGRAESGRPYCVVMVDAWFAPMGLRHRAPPAAQNALGVCQLVALHGLPGPAMEGWLGRGGTGFAARRRPRPVHGGPCRRVREAAERA